MGTTESRSIAVGEMVNLDDYCIVWLDETIHSNLDNCRLQEQFRKFIDHFEPFDQATACVNYVRNVSKDQRILFIVSGRLGREIVPKIHRLPQIILIYVFCSNKAKHEKWASKYFKIKGVVVDLEELIGQMRTDRARRVSLNAARSCFFDVYRSNVEHQSVNNPFLHNQLLFYCLTRMKSSIDDRKEFLSSHGDTSSHALNLDDFQKNYSSEHALNWYLEETILSRLLNKALKTQQIDLLYQLRFFLHDIHVQMNSHRCSSPIRVYRGQIISQSDLETFKRSLGHVISINSFLLTTLQRETAIRYLDETDESVKILFEIDADPRLAQTQPFCSMSSLNSSTNENNADEILFMFASLFHIKNIQQHQDHYTIVQLTSCSRNDSQLKTLNTLLQTQCADESLSLLTFPDILWTMGKLNESEKYYQRLLNHFSLEHRADRAHCYFRLGNIAMERDNLQSSSNYHQKALELKEEICIANDPSLADSYSSMADIERKKNNRQQALTYYNQALDIWQANADKCQDKIAMSLNNIACLYGEEKNYQKTLEYQQKALEVMKKLFPSDHLCLGQAYHNLGSVYRSLDQSELALEHYQTSLKIKSKVFSPHHLSIAATLHSIGSVYEQTDSSKEALSYYEKVASIYRQQYPPNHPDYLRVQADIQRLSSQMKT